MFNKYDIRDNYVKQEGIKKSKLKSFLFYYRLYLFKQIVTYVVWFVIPSILYLVLASFFLSYIKGEACAYFQFGHKPGDAPRPWERRNRMPHRVCLAYIIVPGVICFLIALFAALENSGPGPIINFYY